MDAALLRSMRAGLAAVILATAGGLHAAEVKVLASAALKAAYLEMQPEFERATGHRLVTVWAPTAEMAKRVGSGEAVDLVIMATDRIDELIKSGRIVSGSRVDLARSSVGIAVRAGAPKPDLTSADAVKRTLLSAKSIAYSTGLSGTYVAGLLQRLGIADELKPKVKQFSGVPIGEVVARGEAEIGFQQMSELFAVTGIQAVPLPPEIQHTFYFAAGVPAAATDPEAARALARFLTTPAAASAIRKTGLDPG
jgi:molybdate transport system substrate-binding protein